MGFLWDTHEYIITPMEWRETLWDPTVVQCFPMVNMDPNKTFL